MSTYQYSKLTDIELGIIDESVLEEEINKSTISQSLQKITVVLDDIQIAFLSSLRVSEKFTLDSILQNHQGDPLKPVKQIIQNAKDFFETLLIDFASENVAMGITQVGKTKAVADYLRNVMYYGQSGSLYEVLSEITNLESQGFPIDLAPFVTEDRMNAFKLKIQEYLGI